MINLASINRSRYAKVSKEAFNKNEKYSFSRRYALHVFPSNAIYNFIPKNGCSSLRFSLAIANGYLDPSSDPRWIHHNINCFSPLFHANDFTLATSPYTFVILRCPYRRLASAFIDKGIGLKLPVQLLCKTIDSSINSKDKMTDSIQKMNFTSFVEALTSLPREKLDEHFRPQVDFLALDDYDRWFCMEDFINIEERLKSEIGFMIHDTRKNLGHDTSSFLKEDLDFSMTPISQLQKLKSKGRLPLENRLFTEKTKNLVREYFVEDFDMYEKLFGMDNLLFKY